jgi:serine phosphatase RsbU (regulator of sigma subunit)/ligand-binding sensor domain-containing protein
MRFRTFLIVFLSVTAFSLPNDAFPQSHSYRYFNNSNGLPGNYINTISQDNHGVLWLGMETGLYRHDGFDFFKVQLPDTLTTGYPCSSFCDADGTMWFGYSDGSIYSYTPGEKIKRGPAQADKINRIISDTKGDVCTVSQSGGITRFDRKRQGTYINYHLSKEISALLDVAFISQDSLLVATQDNLHLCTLSGDSIRIAYTFPELKYTWVQTIKLIAKDTWIAGTDGSGIFLVEKRPQGILVFPIFGVSQLDNSRVKDIVAVDEHTVYVATRDTGVVKMTFSREYNAVSSDQSFNTSTGLAENSVQSLFADREGNLWIGLFSKGLEAVTTNAFSFYTPSFNKEVRFIGSDGKKIIMGNRQGIFDFNPVTGQFSDFRNLSSKLGGAPISAWHYTSDGYQWIGTDGEGLFRISPDGSIRSFYRSVNPGSNRINGIDSDSKYIWLATLDGVMAINRNDGTLKKCFTTTDMLPHNKTLGVVVTSEGEALVATETDKLCYVKVGEGIRNGNLAMTGFTRNTIQSISISDSDRTISIGTLGNGLYRFKGDTLFNVTTQEGLMSNYVYSVLAAPDGRIWAGHEKGFSVWDPALGTIRTFSKEFGVNGDCLPNAVYRADNGAIYIGTTDGVVVYNPEKEKKEKSAPEAAIISVKIDGVDYLWQPSFTLPYKKMHNIEIHYSGLNLSDPLNVVYRTKLKNFDDDYCLPTSERSVTYKLSDGHYRFIVKAATKDNLSLTGQAEFELTIKKPFYRSWWGTIIWLLMLVGAVYGIMSARERAIRKRKEYLERELDLRTREVQEQKEELFQKNTDITESIKYAKRIQNSVLPDISRLSTVFNEAFIFFAPRDIVSGDFYWFDWIDKERFIVVCADSTGHGVPGAFMSMIGTALLQDIVTRKKITRPSAILRELDRQIFSTLNQNQEVEAANDGMDLVVCEFNFSNRHLTFASAMRPVILVLDGEQHYVRGNRSSIGGESVSEKFFDDQEYTLREGDIVYLFSDGFPDQFGGNGNKKMKISRLRNLIDEIKGLPLDEQHKRMMEFFYDWKGDFDQVDDVMFMGLKM